MVLLIKNASKIAIKIPEIPSLLAAMQQLYRGATPTDASSFVFVAFNFEPQKLMILMFLMFHINEKTSIYFGDKKT